MKLRPTVPPGTADPAAAGRADKAAQVVTSEKVEGKKQPPVTGHSEFDTAVARTEAAPPAAPVQARGVGFSMGERVDPPTFTGRVVAENHRVELELANGQRLALASSPKEDIHASRWGGEAGSFAGMTIQVRGFLDDSGNVLHAEELIPGAGPNAKGVHGRIVLGPQGEVLVRALEGRKYEVKDARLAGILKDWTRVAFILSGESSAKMQGAERVHSFDGDRIGMYLLTLLNPGQDDGLAFFDTPFEKVAVALPPGGVPPESMGRRIFVYGEPTTADDPAFAGKALTGIKRFFKLQWIGAPIDGKAVTAAAELGGSVGIDSKASHVLKSQEGFERSARASPQWPYEVAFAPPAQRLEGAPPASGVNQLWNGLKHGRWETKIEGKNAIENWFAGRKVSAGPIDDGGRPHGAWAELKAVPTEGAPRGGEGAYAYVPSLQGSYEHGLRSGTWRLQAGGKPSNFWEYQGGKMLRSGNLDEKGQLHGSFRFTAAPDYVLDGGEGEYENGKVVGFEYHYRPGTSEYGYVKQRDDDGKLLAEGAARKWVVPWRDTPYFVRDGQWKFYDDAGKEVPASGENRDFYGPHDHYRLEGAKIEVPDEHKALFG